MTLSKCFIILDLIKPIETKVMLSTSQQECIPVGCVPPIVARISQHALLWGGGYMVPGWVYLVRGGYLPRGVYLVGGPGPRGVPGPGGCIPGPRGVYLVLGDVPGPGGGVYHGPGGVL